MIDGRQKEQLVESGLPKKIRMSNMTIAKMDAVLLQPRIVPMAHEMERHPSFQQKELFNYCWGMVYCH